MNARVPMKPVSPEVVAHPVEQRGFVRVPLDHTRGEGAIDIFYRLIPKQGQRPDDPSAPIVLVINGGPGIPASFYRPLDYDYAALRMPRGGLDRLHHLTTRFRVLIADQRGTDGQSAPLDMDDPGIDPDTIARLFSSDSHALDYLAVVDAVVPEGEPFWVIAQSYGGLPGMQLVAQRARRRPEGVVFSSSALPYTDPVEAMRARRREQLRLNLQLRSAVPDIGEHMARARARLEAEGLDPSIVHGLYVLLGKDAAGWEAGVVKRLSRIAGQTRAEIEADVAAGMEAPSLLNYILSSANFTPGHTDRTLAAMGSAEIPFEAWMIDEHEMLMRTGQDGTWRQELVARIDASPPPATPFPSMEALREAMGDTRQLFTAASDDAFVPGGDYKASVSRFLVPGHGQLAELPGGHNAIFLARGLDVMSAWMESGR